MDDKDILLQIVKNQREQALEAASQLTLQVHKLNIELQELKDKKEVKSVK